MDRVNVNYYVIDSDSSLAEFKRLFNRKRQFIDGKTDYIDHLFNKFNEIELEERQLVTIATIEVQAKQILNLTNTYKPEYIAMINSSDTAVTNTAHRKYGDCYAVESIIGGSGYDLRTYYVPTSCPYTLSQVRQALLEHIISYFNTDTLLTESDITNNILKSVYQTLPICVSATPGGVAGSDFASLSIGPEKIKNFIRAMTNPAKTGTISYRFAEYNPPTE